MKKLFHGLFPVLVTTAGFVGLVIVLVNEIGNVRRASRAAAERELESRTALVRESLIRPLSRSDFPAVYTIGESCEADGYRLTVQSANGRGTFFDSRRKSDDHDFLFSTAQVDAFTIRLGVPKASVYAAAKRGRLGLLLAGLSGASGLLLLFLSFRRVRAKLHELEEMKRLEAFRRTFIADVSHEIKTPLTGILGCVELLQGGDALPSDQRSRLLAMLKTESTRLNTLAQGILSLAKLEHSGETSIALEASDLSSIATTAIERTQTKAEAAGVKLTLSVPTDPVNVRCNPGLVEEAVVNLIENALRHSQSPEVIVTVKANALTVEDHGIGLSAEDKPHVFERFWRADASRTSDTGGSGLGLAIVKEIVRVNDADITLDTQPGRGCRFTITFAKAR